MSYVHADQTALDADHGGRADRRALGELFRAHTSPAFHRLVQLRATGGDHTSLATCEKVPTSRGESGQPTERTTSQLTRSGQDNQTTVTDASVEDGQIENSSGGTVNQSNVNHPQSDLNPPTPSEMGEELGYVSDATEAIRAAISRSRDRQRKVLALIGAGEVAHAKRLALCGRRSVQLECPEIAGGCGSEDNYVPVSCDSRLCSDCMDRKMGRTVERYRGPVASFDHPTMFRLGLPNRVAGDDLDRAKDALVGAFGRLRRRVIPADGEHQGKRWVWSDDGGKPADHYWRSALIRAGERDLAQYWETKYINQGKGIPFEEIARSGLYGVDMKQKDDGRFNVHVHVIADVPYVPQAALAAEWDAVVGAPVVDVRRIDERGEQGAESALAEAVGYAAKAPEFASAEDEAHYLSALKGSKLIQPFGDLHGNTPRVSGLLRCTDCEMTPAYWEYLGYCDHPYDTMTVAGSGEDGDRPPPDN